MRIAITEQTRPSIAPPTKWINPEAAMRITHARKQRVTRATRSLAPLFDDDEANKPVLAGAWTPRRLAGRQPAFSVR